MTVPRDSQPDRPADRRRHEGGHDSPSTVLWLPPQRLRRYAIMKALGAAGFAAIFAGWMLIQWSNPAMRIAATVLIGVTVVVTARTIVADRRRAAGRQVALTGGLTGGLAGGATDGATDGAKPDAGRLTVTTPNGTAEVSLATLAAGRWREDAGLDLLDADGRTLATLDRGLVEDEREARAFLGWLRARSGLALRVKWTDERKA